VSYTVQVGDARPVRVKTVRDAGVVVMEAVTGMLAQDPESVARDASAVNLAFSSGAVEHSLTAHRTWRTALTVHGEQVPIAIAKRRWYLLCPVLRVVRGVGRPAPGFLGHCVGEQLAGYQGVVVVRAVQFQPFS
jgi:hypothetical protein